MKGKNRPVHPSMSHVATLLSFILLSNVFDHHKLLEAQITIPAKFDGFVYGEASQFNPKNILIEAFFDPVCKDTRDAWPPLKQALQYYGSRVSLIVHPFPLPYHDNAFLSSKALHIVNELNSSAIYPLLENFFMFQLQFYNSGTINMSRSEILDHIVDFVTKTVGQNYYSAVKNGFNDTNTELKTRMSFKYACARGVFGTPTFFVNGFALPDTGSPLDYNGWRKIIDPLVVRPNGEHSTPSYI